MEQKHLIISGLVQGVGFRAWTKWLARKLGLVGWVKNRADGAVELVASGKKEVVAEFVTACHKGPDMAQVDTVEVIADIGIGEFDEFTIIRD